MDIDKQIEAYLLSHKKQFSRLSKEGVARIAYLSGYLAAQQSVQQTVDQPCEKHNMEFCSECFPVVVVDFNRR